MSYSLGILLGLSAAISWGVMDVLAKKVVSKIGSYKTFFFSQIFSFIILVLFGGVFGVKINSLFIFSLIGINALFMVGAYLLFYKAMEYIDVSIVTPISSIWSLFTILMGVILLGERLGKFQIVSIFLIIGGMILTLSTSKSIKNIFDSAYFKEKMKRKAIIFLLINVVLAALWYFFVKLLVDTTGPFSLILISKFFFVVFSLPFIFHKTKSNVKNHIWYLVIMGILDAIAFFLSVYVVKTEFLSISTPLISLYPIATVLLARYILNEKLTNRQKLGILGVVIGVVLLGL